MAHIDIVEGARDADIAEWIATRLGAELRKNEAPVAICVPGGTTPFPILEILSKHELDWGRVTVWPGDDRLVAEDHPASNTGRIRALLEPAGAEVVTLSEMEEVPRFALAWLGMGADGHTASIFVGPDLQAALDAPKARRAIGVLPDPLPAEAEVARVTLTRAAILSARTVLITITGQQKRDLLEQAIADGQSSKLPIGRVLAEAEQPIDIHWAP